MNAQTNNLIRIIKFTPLFVILFSCMLVIGLMYQELEKDLQNEKVFTQTRYIETEKNRISNLTNTFINYIKSEKQKSEKKLKQNLKYQINIVHKIATNIYDKNRDSLSKKEIIKLIKNAIETIRFDEGRGYFSIHTIEGMNILHPTNRNFEGTSVLNRRDVKGNYPVQEAIKIAKTKGEGFFTWYYSKPNDKSQEFKKVGIVKKFEPYDFIITTAIYIDDFEKSLQKDVLSHISSFKYKDGASIVVINYDGKVLLHPSQKILHHNVLKEKQFSYISGFFKELISKLDNKEGEFITFKPMVSFDKDTTERKTIYAKKFQDWEWIISARFKLSDANKVIEQRKIFLQEKYSNYEKDILLYGAISTIILLMISFFIANLVEKKFLLYRKREKEQTNEKLKVKDKLLETNKQLTNISKNIPGAIFTFQLYSDGRNCFPYASNEIYDVFGVTVQDMLEDSTNVFDLLYPEDLVHVNEKIQISFEQLTIWEDEYRVVHPEKGTIWLKGMSRPEKQLDGSVVWYGYVYDMTKEKIAENEIVRLKDFYNNIIDSVDSLVFVKDSNSVFITCNKAFENFLGSTRDQIIGKTDYDFFPKEIADYFFEQDQNIFSQKEQTSSFDWVNSSDAGSTYFLSTKSPLFDKDGTLVALVAIATDFSEQQHLLERLKEAQSLAKIGSWEYDIVQDELTASDELLKIYGFTNFSMKLQKDTLHNTFHPDDKEMADQTFIDSMHTKEITVSQNRMIRQGDEEIRYLEHRWRTEYENEIAVKTVGTTQDITERKEAEQKLLTSNNKFEKAFNSTPNLIVISSPKTGKIYDINQTFINTLGYAREELIGQTTLDLNLWKHSDERKIFVDALTENGSIENMIFTINKKDGDTMIANIFANIVNIDNEEYILSVAADITELKEKDEMLINQSRHAAMGEMIGMIAHQWRQPLSVISMEANNMLLDIALEDFSCVEAEKYANSITVQTQNLSQTIDDFRNFFKPDKVISKVNVKNILDQTLSIVKESLKNNNIKLTISYQTEKEVNAYPRELMQVFVNIINNSKDALLSNNKDNASIDIEVYEDTIYVNTKICDNGGGIENHILSKVFDPYFSTKDEKTGTGLGLYISKMIIEDHLNGVIEVNNTGKGACFTIKLLKT